MTTPTTEHDTAETSPSTWMLAAATVREKIAASTASTASSAGR